MKTGHVIIGANYGDEGKGLMTDYLASLNPDSLVVRFNGGAQAGHTVVAEDGRRFVFSHFPSGCLSGCHGFLSRYFIVNPLVYVRELSALKAAGVHPRLYIDTEAFISTPWDMFINQLLETRRAKGKHGSCGLGINETVTRCLRSHQWCTRVRDLLNQRRLQDILCRMAKQWLPERLLELGLSISDEAVAKFLANVDRIMEVYLSEVDVVLATASLSPGMPAYRHLIFEGAQGLLLDEDRIDQWPHVTRSKTGLHNVMQLAEQAHLSALEVTYVTRTYLTRHGAGPLPAECDWSFHDATNVPNRFQGNLRFAPLDAARLSASIKQDLELAGCLSSVPVQANIAVTCLDQLPLPFSMQSLPVPARYLSRGPQRACVEPVVATSQRLLRQPPINTSLSA